MKGIDVAIADPIPALNEYDDRPSVKDLISRHRAKIDNLTQEIQNDPLFDPNKHDDLWMLRFVLSHKKKNNKLDSAIKSAKYTLKFRKEHELDEEDIRPYMPNRDNEHPRAGALKEYLKYSEDNGVTCFIPDEKRGPVSFVKYTSVDQHKLAAQFPEEMWLSTFLYLNEWCHQWLDYVTRTTGRLTKNVRIIDLDGMTLQSVSRDHTKQYGKVMAIMEECYPQLLHGIYICKPPTWIHIPWRIARPFLPKRVIEKIDFVNPHRNDREKKTLLRFLSDENLPARFGGKNDRWPVAFPVPPTQHQQHDSRIN